MSAHKWVGGGLIGIGALLDLDALDVNKIAAQNPGPNEAAAAHDVKTGLLLVGTSMMAGGLFVFTRPSKPAGQTRRRSPRYTGRAR